MWGYTNWGGGGGGSIFLHVRLMILAFLASFDEPFTEPSDVHTEPHISAEYENKIKSRGKTNNTRGQKSHSSRVEVWSENNVRLEVNSGEKKKFFTAKRSHLIALNVLKAVNFCKNCVEFCSEFFFSPHSPDFLQKRNCRTRVPNTYLPQVTNFLFQCEFFFRRILLVAVLSPLKRLIKFFQRINNFFSPHSSH